MNTNGRKHDPGVGLFRLIFDGDSPGAAPISRSPSRQLSRLFAATKPGRCRTPRRGALRRLEALEPRTLLSNLWYVNSSDSGTPDGLTPATGFLTIQAAINAAQPSDTILIETGNGCNESDTINVSNLTIEADTNQSPILDGTTPTAQSSAGFIVAPGTTGVTIKGLTCQNFTGTSAIVVWSGASLSLSNDTIENNSTPGYGGGIFSVGTLTLANSTFTGNAVTGYGGGVFNYFGSVTLTSDGFSGNSAGQGGGGFLTTAGTAVVTDCTFLNNSATDGGAIWAYTPFSGPTTITDCTLNGKPGSA
jgi:predicted outer membrane repeat protein